VTNIGLWFDVRNPPESRRSWSALYGEVLELCEEADHLGAHSVWLSEHHLFDDGYLSQPFTLAAAIAARTKTVRIGTAVVLAPLRTAEELAEQSALVDVLSDGRFELGLGAGHRVPEFELFGADLERRYTTTDQRVRDVRRLWQDPRLLPPPVQAHPRIWLGYQGPRGARRAGLLGESLLTVNPDSVAPYLAGLREGGHDLSAARMAGGINAWVSDDPEADWPVVAERLAYQWNSYRRHMVEGTGGPLPALVDPERYRARGLDARPGHFLLATPEAAAVQIAKYLEGTPAETLFIWVSIGGMAYELTQQHMRTLVCDLAPRLKQLGAADAGTPRRLELYDPNAMGLGL
jgi:alkanesulfonate monooxygenase SsuD/methylene tetrahydromethanopterin reductase-like flavin-dependent oxidoreductase (luciferase family)